MRYMPDFNICYLSELDKNQFPDPESLAKHAETEKALKHVVSIHI